MTLDITAKSSDRQKPAGALLRPGVQVAACDRDRCVAEGGLDQMDGGAAVEGMGGVRMTEPVRRHF